MVLLTRGPSGGGLAGDAKDCGGGILLNPLGAGSENAPYASMLGLGRTGAAELDVIEGPTDGTPA